MHQIVSTNDNSKSIYSELFNESFHSKYGAISESKHIFIHHGLSQFVGKSVVNIFEVGFGTGLNALLSYKFSKENKLRINYFAIEKFPLAIHYFSKLNYSELIDLNPKWYKKIYNCPYGIENSIDENFSLYKINADLIHYSELHQTIDLVYFDAFSPEIQPELWNIDIFRKLYNQMSSEGILTTYCSKGVVRRTLQQTGFMVERLAGPIGKREVLRARKSV